MLGTSNL